MIKVKHPEPHCNEAQEAALAHSPANQKRFQELFFSYANATYRYHQEAEEHRPTRQDYEEWLEGLSPNLSKAMAEKGFEECRTMLSFTRYVQEKNDVGLDEYVRGLMGEAEHEEYRALML